MRSSTVMVLVGLALGVVASGAPVPADEIADRIETYVEPFVAAGHLSGSLVVARRDEILFEGAWGDADQDRDLPIAADTRLCVASITKPMTQIIALKLIESGALALDDPLSKWIPDFPRGDEITVEMIAWHKAGIPHQVTTDSDERQPMTAADMVDRAMERELLFDPGTDTTYSSGGYSVLARVLELASGKSYEELLAEYVFGPAGMTASVHPTTSPVEGSALSYRFDGNGDLVASPLKNYSFLVGAGSVFSTPEDLLRLMRTVVAGGYGPAVKDTLMRRGNLAWNGRTDGYRAFADYHPDSDIYLAFVSNVLTGAGDLLRRDLPRLAGGESVDPPEIPRYEAVEVADEILQRYVGGYDMGNGTVLDLTVEDGEVRMTGWLLVPTSETSFFSPQDYGEIRMRTDAEGRVEGLDWSVGGRSFPMSRVVEPQN